MYAVIRLLLAEQDEIAILLEVFPRRTALIIWNNLIVMSGCLRRLMCKSFLRWLIAEWFMVQCCELGISKRYIKGLEGVVSFKALIHTDLFFTLPQRSALDFSDILKLTLLPNLLLHFCSIIKNQLFQSICIITHNPSITKYFMII